MPRILFVEDDDSTRVLVARLLARRGFDVVGAVHGRDGLDHLAASGPFDLVVTDLMMPEMSGIEFISRVRPLYPDLPIVVTSAFTGHREEVLQAGAARFLAKPYGPPELLEAIEKTLARR